MSVSQLTSQTVLLSILIFNFILSQTASQVLCFDKQHTYRIILPYCYTLTVSYTLTLHATSNAVWVIYDHVDTVQQFISYYQKLYSYQSQLASYLSFKTSLIQIFDQAKNIFFIGKFQLSIQQEKKQQSVRTIVLLFLILIKKVEKYLQVFLQRIYHTCIYFQSHFHGSNHS